MATTLLRPREERVLRNLVLFRFLTREQVQRMVFDHTYTPDSQAVMTRRVLNKLRALRLIDSIPNAIGPTPVYYPSKSGELYVGKANSSPAGRPKGTFLLRHQTALAEVALALSSTGKLKRWEADWQLAGRLEGRVIPDAFAVYSGDLGEIHAFIELDMGTVSAESFKGKVGRYLAYYASGEWEEQFQVWPAIVTVTQNDYRANFLRGVTERMGVPEEMEFSFVSLPRIQREGAAGEIYQLVGQRGFHRVF